MLCRVPGLNRLYDIDSRHYCNVAGITCVYLSTLRPVSVSGAERFHVLGYRVNDLQCVLPGAEREFHAL